MDDTGPTIRNDEPTGEDTLKRDQYAEAFARIAGTCDTPMVIGLYGTWGVGKTSLMKLIEKKLDTSTTRTVRFDPWQHQFDENPVLAMLHTVVDTFNLREEGKKLLTVIAGAFGSMLLKATTTLKVKDIDEFGKRFEEKRFQVRETRVRLHEHFRELMEKARGSEKKRIVFFIDDLDRCLPPHILSILESLKLYLNFPGCVYFLGVDRLALERSIKHYYKDTELSETNYLDKIVQLPFNIPPIAPESMEEFISPLLSEDLGPCHSLLVAGLGDNPRSVKRFINTLTLNHMLASGLSIPGYNITVLATLLLIQQRSRELYDLIVRQPDLLLKLRLGDEETKSILDKYLKPDERLENVINALDIKDDTPLERYIYLTQVAGVETVGVQAEDTAEGIEELKIDIKKF